MGIKVKVNFDKRKLESAIKDQARESLHNRSYDAKCPFVIQLLVLIRGQMSVPIAVRLLI